MTDSAHALWTAWTSRRDERAFEALVVSELPHAMGFARALGCSDEDAQDAVQDALARLASAPGDLPVSIGIRAWLCREIHTRARSRLRSERRRLQRQHAVARPEVQGGDDAALVARDEVERALDALDADDRPAVELRYLHDLDYREMALVLDVGEAACRQRVHRALGRLRERFGERAAALVAALPLPAVPNPSAFVRRATSGAAAGPATTITMGAILMTTKAKILVAFALLAIATVAALQLAGTPAPPTAPSDADVADSHEVPADRDNSRPRERTKGASETAAAPSNPDDVVASVPPEPARALPVVLVGHVGVPIGSPPAETSVAVRAVLVDGRPGGRTEPVSATADFEIDVTDLVAAPDAVTRVHELVVSADRPGFLPREERVLVPSEWPRSTPGAARRTLRLDIDLERAAVLAGIIHDPAGDPVAGADVGAFRRQPDRTLDFIDKATTGTDGSYRVRLRPGSEHVLVVASPAFAPVAQDVRADGDRRDTDPIVLSRGETISGRVLESDGSPFAGVAVEATTDAQKTRLAIGQQRLVLREDGVVALAPAVTVTNQEGRYVLRGLTAEDHQVHVVVPQGTPDLERQLARRVQAPAHDVDFLVGGSWIVVEVRQDGNPVRDAWVFVIGHLFGQTRRTGADGRLQFRVADGAKYELRAGLGEMDPVEREVEGPPTGRRQTYVFDLDARPAGATVVLEVSPPDGDSPPERLGVLLYEPGVDRPFPTFERTAERGEDGRYVVTDAPSGRYRLVVQPGGRSFFASSGYFRLVEADLDVPASGTIERSFELQPAGRLRLSVRTADGAYPNVPCVVRDAEGVALDVNFVHGSSSSKYSLGGEGPADIEPPLAAGRYRVEVEADGFHPEVRDVQVRLRETTVVEVTLRPE